MVSKFGALLFSPKFGALAQEGIDEAIAEANAKGLPKAYDESRPAPVVTRVTRGGVEVTNSIQPEKKTIKARSRA
jgi:hypothetical protein